MDIGFDPTQVTKLHVRNSEFFGSSARFKEFKEDVERSRYSEITDVDMECSGYGHFNPDKVLENFFNEIHMIL